MNLLSPLLVDLYYAAKSSMPIGREREELTRRPEEPWTGTAPAQETNEM
jgi:hypothetical protein